MVDAMRYLLGGGVAWRVMPHEDPPWPTVYHYFRQCHLDGTWERANASLRGRVRQRAGRAAPPTAAIQDRQSVRTTEKGASVAMTGPRN